MNLKDFYFQDKAMVGDKMEILLPDGSPSGEWLNVVSPDADVAVKAGRAFLFAYQAKISELEEVKEDKTKYALLLNDACEDLNRQLALEIVNGWSFDEPFTKEAMAELLRQYSALASMVSNFQAGQRKKLQEK